MPDEKIVYKKFLVLDSLKCFGCRQRIVPGKYVPVADEEAIAVLAGLVHAQSGVICGSPTFSIVFHQELLDARIIDHFGLAAGNNGGA